MGPSPPMENIWEITDGLWQKIEPVLLAADPPKATGRKRVDQRRMLDGVVYKMRSGCRWNNLPRELGDDSTIHRAYQRWVRLGVFAQVWSLLEEHEELERKTAKYPGFTGPAESLNAEKENADGSRSRRVS